MKRLKNRDRAEALQLFLRGLGGLANDASEFDNDLLDVLHQLFYRLEPDRHTLNPRPHAYVPRAFKKAAKRVAKLYPAPKAAA